MPYQITDAVEVSRGQLTTDQIVALDRALAHHNLPQSTPHTTPETLAFVCLNCSSIGEAPDRASRDSHVENFDFTCCGLTVTFHSDHKTLVDIDKLTFIVHNSTI